MGNIISIFKLETKKLLRNFFFPTIYFGTLFLLLVRYKNVIDLDTHWLGGWTSTIDYSIIFSVLGLICIGIYLSNDKNEVIDILNISPAQKLTGNLLTIIFFVLSIVLQPVLIMIFHMLYYNNISIDNFMRLFVDTTITFGIGLTFASIIGLFIGLLFKELTAYILAPIVTLIISPLGTHFFQPMNRFLKFFLDILNIKINSAYLENPFTSVILGTKYWFMKFFLITLCILILLITLQIKTKTTKKILCMILVTSIVNLCTMYGAYINFPKDINMAQNSTIEESYIKIKKYKMNIEINDTFKNKCTLTVLNTNKNDLNKILLNLDSTFKISKIESKGKQLKFNHNSDILKIDLPVPLKSLAEANLNITYSGKINYIDSLGLNVAFSFKNSCLLLDKISWYPKATFDNEKDFQVTVHSFKDIHSNLQLAGCHNNEYKLSGFKKDIFLLSGYLTEIKKDNLLIYVPEEFGISAQNRVINFVKHMSKIAKLDIYNKPVYFVPLDPNDELLKGKLSLDKFDAIFINQDGIL